MKHKRFLDVCKKRDDFSEYEVLSQYEKSTLKVKFRHLLCGKEFEMKANNFTSNKQKCPHCSKNKKIDNEEFLRRVSEKVGDEYTFKDKYVTTHTKLNVIHNVCGYSYKVRPNDFLNSGDRCPKCSNHIHYNLEIISKKIKELDADYEFIAPDSTFESVHSILLIRHAKCNRIFKKSFNNFRNGQRCKHCTKENSYSKPFMDILNYLDDNNVNYKTEITFNDLKNPKTGRHLRFDLYLTDYDIYIEYDGKQHFHHYNEGYFTHDVVSEIKYRDRIKDEYCKVNKLNLIRINYKQNHIKEIEKILNSTTIM